MKPSEERVLREASSWRFTQHARTAMVERGFDPFDVMLAVIEPELKHSGENYRFGQMVHKRGKVTVIVDPYEKVVVTVLLRSYLVWDNEMARAANRP